MPKTSEAQKRAKKNYQKNVTRLTVDFYPTEKDLVEQIAKQPKKQTYIKDLIRADMESGGENAVIDADAYEYPGDLIHEPTIDAAPVVHGRWIYHECVSSYDWAISGYSCSECNVFVDEEIFDMDEFHKYFCGHCGAKMDRKEEEK